MARISARICGEVFVPRENDPLYQLSDLLLRKDNALPFKLKRTRKAIAFATVSVTETVRIAYRNNQFVSSPVEIVWIAEIVAFSISRNESIREHLRSASNLTRWSRQLLCSRLTAKTALRIISPVHRCGQATELSALGIDNKGARFWAERQARRDVERKLKSAIEVVPCPACGWYQAGMCWQIRRGKQELALCILVLCAMGTAFFGLFFLNQQFEKLTAVALSIVTICIGIRLQRFWFRKYTPNRNHPGKGGVDRVKAATSCSIRKEDVDNSTTRSA